MSIPNLGVPCALTGNILISAQRTSDRGPIGQCNTRHITQWRPHPLGQCHSRIVDDVPFITSIGFEEDLSARKDSRERIWCGDVIEGRGIEIGFPEELTQLVFLGLSARLAERCHHDQKDESQVTDEARIWRWQPVRWVDGGKMSRWRGR